MGMGILFCIAAGLIWALGGVTSSRCAKYKLDVVTYLLAYAVFSMVIGGVMFAVGVGKGEINSHTWKIAGIIFVAGMLNVCGSVTLQKAMEYGHHGISFLLSQAAMALPFLVNTLGFGDPAGVVRFGGAGVIIVGMCLCTQSQLRQKQESAAAPDQQNPIAALKFALAAFAFFGCSQTVMTIPARLQLVDSANVRNFALFAGATTMMLGIALVRYCLYKQKLWMDKRVIIPGVVVAALSVAAMGCTFMAIDRLAPFGATGIVFALAIGANILCFTLYSLLILKEECRASTVLGLCLIVAGGFMLFN